MFHFSFLFLLLKFYKFLIIYFLCKLLCFFSICEIVLKLFLIIFPFIYPFFKVSTLCTNTAYKSIFFFRFLLSKYCQNYVKIMSNICHSLAALLNIFNKNFYIENKMKVLFKNLTGLSGAFDRVMSGLSGAFDRVMSWKWVLSIG